MLTEKEIRERIHALKNQWYLPIEQRTPRRSSKSLKAEIKRLEAASNDLRQVEAKALAALHRRGLELGRAIALALEIASAYHQNISRLWRSMYARPVYGQGGGYSWSWAGPWRRSWKAAGASWRIERNALVLVIENCDGKRVIAMRMPRSLRGVSAAGCIHGDAYSVADRRRPNVVVRYSVNGERTGVAVRYTHPESGRLYWEHGLDIAECEREHQNKVRLAEEERRREREEMEERRRRERERARQRAKEERRARLLARLSDRVLVTREHAYEAGACRAGVAAWCERVGISPEETARPAREIVRLAERSGERMALAAAIRAARQAIQQARAQ